MAMGDVQTRQLIQAAMDKRTGGVADVALALWQPLATQLISLIGEGGFNALYVRSHHLTRATFPWLAPGEASRFAENWFAELTISLEGQSPPAALLASRMLLLTFTNILASLIGEPLTLEILRSAWGDDASAPEIAGKEFLK